MAFAGTMKQEKGVLGVATYVKHNRVKIYYDPKILTVAKIQELLFTPSKTALKPLRKGIAEVKEVTVWLENFFDPYDFNYLTRLLVEKTGAVGLVSEYACPVVVKIYFPADTEVNENELIDILESKTLTFQVGDGNKTIDLGYKVGKGPQFRTISSAEYATVLFKPYLAEFNGFAKYDSTVVKIYELFLGTNKENKAKFPYLVSHLSNNKGIIGFRTILNDQFEEKVAISYVDSLVNTKFILETMNSDSLHYSMRNGTKGKIVNVFKFEDNTEVKKP
jgi:hypothetical protein